MTKKKKAPARRRRVAQPTRTVTVTAEPEEAETVAVIAGKLEAILSESRPTFERMADETIATTRATYGQRGGEYGDSWAIENMVATFTEHTLKAIGSDRSPEAIRLVVMAALVDVKDSRMTGLFKLDSVVDGIAYRAAYGALRAEYERRRTMPYKR